MLTMIQMDAMIRMTTKTMITMVSLIQMMRAHTDSLIGHQAVLVTGIVTDVLTWMKISTMTMMD